MKNVFNYRVLLLPGLPKLGATAWMTRGPKAAPRYSSMPFRLDLEAPPLWCLVVHRTEHFGAAGAASGRPSKQCPAPDPQTSTGAPGRVGPREPHELSLPRAPRCSGRPLSWSSTCRSPPLAPGDTAPHPGPWRSHTILTPCPPPKTRARAHSHTRLSQRPGFLFSARFLSVFPLPLVFSEKYLLVLQYSPSPLCCLFSMAFGFGLFCRNHSFFIWACFIVLFLVSSAESFVHLVITIS